MKLSLVALAFAACACATVPPASAPNRYVERLVSSTVALVDDDGDTYCAGVWVSGDSFVTANHCMRDEDTDELRYQISEGDVTRTAHLVKVDPDHDLALIQTELPPPHDVVSVATTPPRPGDAVAAVGHPFGMTWSYSVGVVSAVRFFDDNLVPALWLVQTTAPTSKGCSGGGLFNERGELVGVAHSSQVRGQNLNLYVHAKYLRAFLGSRDKQWAP